MTEPGVPAPPDADTAPDGHDRAGTPAEDGPLAGMTGRSPAR